MKFKTRDRAFEARWRFVVCAKFTAVNFVNAVRTRIWQKVMIYVFLIFTHFHHRENSCVLFNLQSSAVQSRAFPRRESERKQNARYCCISDFATQQRLLRSLLRRRSFLLSPPKFLFSSSQTAGADTAPQDRETPVRSRANYRTDDKWRRVLLFFGRSLARAPVYIS